MTQVQFPEVAATIFYSFPFSSKFNKNIIQKTPGRELDTSLTEETLSLSHIGKCISDFKITYFTHSPESSVGRANDYSCNENIYSLVTGSTPGRGNTF